ncbi:MAG: HAD family phosphatase [Clostridiales bacterium]|nr:HAD family phosphatase [Clostridiales bacterium]
MIRTVIFDIGNVLTNYRWKGYLHSFGFSKEVEEAVANAVFLNPLWIEFDRGVMGDHAVIEACVEQTPQYEAQIRKLFVDMTELVVEYDYAASLVQDLKKQGYQVYVLSNYGQTLFEYAKKNFQFLQYVDGGVISFQVKKIKPDAAIYEALINQYGICPEEAVFLDDTIKNLVQAEAMGIKTVHVTSYQSIIEGLHRHGVIVGKEENN